ncbi:hypothetical protein Tco_0639915 [Tanacetum coccineum]
MELAKMWIFICIVHDWLFNVFTASRPYIMFAVCACARHQVTPKECHLHAVKRIFRYLKRHPKLGIWYPKESPFDLVAIQTVIMVGCYQERKSNWRMLVFGKKVNLLAIYEQVMKRPLCYINGGFGSNAGLKKRRELNILIKFNGKQRTISESSIRRHLKLNDEEGISTLPEKQLVENLSTVGLTIFCQNHDVLSKRLIFLSRAVAES